VEEQIVFIGPGVMAEAMCKGLIERGGVEPSSILMSGPEQDRLDELEKKYRVKATTNNREAAKQGKVVVLSIKPQRLHDVLEELSGLIPADAVVLSIVAGARLDTMKDTLQHSAVVRAMPNTPAQVGEGITVWNTTAATTPEQEECARFILKALGKEIHVDDEEYLDMATALSGTGPAYVFLFMEAMVDAGVHLGFPRRISEELVVQTIKGAVAYYESHPRHMARLKNQVTSPGGTSAEALYYLEKAGFRTAISRAIWAAYERSVQLGEGKKRKTDV